MEKIIIDMGYPRYRADQILLPLYYKFPKNISEIKQLPKKLINDLIESGYTIGSAKETHRIVSEDGDTTKLLLNLYFKPVLSQIAIPVLSKFKRSPNSLIHPIFFDGFPTISA